MAGHDQRFKQLLREFFAEFVGLFFPAWAERFDFGGLEWLDKEVFTDLSQGERQEMDLVAGLPVRVAATPAQAAAPEPWLALLHTEVEWRDSVAPLRGRMFDYHRLLRARYGRPVLPIALYLRVGLDGVGWDEYEETFWDERLLHFRYAYVGLPALEAFDYVGRPSVLAAALAALMRVPDGRRAELKATALKRVGASGANPAQKFLLAECIEAYLPLEGPHLQEYERLLLSDRYEEARMLGITSYEKGVQTGQRALLRRMVERRFGPLTPAALQRLEEWPADRLAEFGEALLTANSLRELGLEDAPA